MDVTKCFVFVFVLLTISWSRGYDDQDMKCKARERFSGFTRRLGGKKKEFGQRCAQFWPKVSQDTMCYLGIAFKCGENFEGCDDQRAWIGGFQIFDMGDKVETYVPYCCISPEVSVKNTKCRQTTLSGSPTANINYAIPNDRVLYRISCQYTKTLIGQKLNGMKMMAEDCAYTVEKNRRRSTRT